MIIATFCRISISKQSTSDSSSAAAERRRPAETRTSVKDEGNTRVSPDTRVIQNQWQNRILAILTLLTMQQPLLYSGVCGCWHHLCNMTFRDNWWPVLPTSSLHHHVSHCVCRVGGAGARLALTSSRCPRAVSAATSTLCTDHSLQHAALQHPALQQGSLNLSIDILITFHIR